MSGKFPLFDNYHAPERFFRNKFWKKGISDFFLHPNIFVSDCWVGQISLSDKILVILVIQNILKKILKVENR